MLDRRIDANQKKRSTRAVARSIEHFRTGFDPCALSPLCTRVLRVQTIGQAPPVKFEATGAFAARHNSGPPFARDPQAPGLERHPAHRPPERAADDLAFGIAPGRGE